MLECVPQHTDSCFIDIHVDQAVISRFAKSFVHMSRDVNAKICMLRVM